MQNGFSSLICSRAKEQPQVVWFLMSPIDFAMWNKCKLSLWYLCGFISGCATYVVFLLSDKFVVFAKSKELTFKLFQVLVKFSLTR